MYATKAITLFNKWEPKHIMNSNVNVLNSNVTLLVKRSNFEFCDKDISSAIGEKEI